MGDFQTAATRDASEPVLGRRSRQQSPGYCSMSRRFLVPGMLRFVELASELTAVGEEASLFPSPGILKLCPEAEGELPGPRWHRGVLHQTTGSPTVALGGFSKIPAEPSRSRATLTEEGPVRRLILPRSWC